MRRSIAAQSQLSVPPAPALMVTMAARAVLGSAEHPRQLHLLDLVPAFAHGLGGLGARGVVAAGLVGEIQQHLGVVEGLPLLLPRL